MRYLPPPPKGKLRIPAAAFRREKSVVSAASLENKTDADARSRSSRIDKKKAQSGRRERDCGSSTGESNSAELNTQAEEWLVQARLRLAALRSTAYEEVIGPADDAEQVALRAGQDIPIREPVRVPLSNQLNTGKDSEQIAEMVIENRNLISVSLGG